MLTFNEKAREWMRVSRGRLLYGSLRHLLPYDLWIRKVDFLVAWFDDYPRSVEFDWILVKDNEVIKEWDRAPSLTDLFEVAIKHLNN